MEVGIEVTAGVEVLTGKVYKGAFWGLEMPYILTGVAHPYVRIPRAFHVRSVHSVSYQTN